jgi:hypothetical protein
MVRETHTIVNPTWDYYRTHLLVEQVRYCLNQIEGEIEKQDTQHDLCDKAIKEQAQLAIDKLKELL